jgi:integrase
MPDALPRALTPDVDRALTAAFGDLDDVFAATGLRLLRATGMRVGELLDLELDCLLDFDRHGTWLRVPLGKLNSERVVPLEPDTVAVIDAWTTQRGRQRALPHPRHGRPTEFLFLEHGRRPTSFRLRKGLVDAVAAAGLRGRDGQPLHVTPHQLRHIFGTALINGGIGLPALMALMGHVTPEMTLRYANPQKLHQTGEANVSFRSWRPDRDVRSRRNAGFGRVGLIRRSHLMQDMPLN